MASVIASKEPDVQEPVVVTDGFIETASEANIDKLGFIRVFGIRMKKFEARGLVAGERNASIASSRREGFD